MQQTSLPQISRNNVILNAIVPKVRLRDNAGQKSFFSSGGNCRVCYRRCTIGNCRVCSWWKAAQEGSWASQIFLHTTKTLLSSQTAAYLLIVCEMSLNSFNGMVSLSISILIVPKVLPNFNTFNFELYWDLAVLQREYKEVDRPKELRKDVSGFVGKCLAIKLQLGGLVHALVPGL